MTKSALLATVGLCVSAFGAPAADWTIKSRLNENFEASNNYFLTPNPIGGTYVSTSFLTVDAIARTPTTRFQLNSDMTFRAYGGPGAQNQPDALDGGGRIGLEKRTDPLTTYNLAASWHEQDATTAQLNSFGAVIVGGTIRTSTIEGGVTRDLTSRDTITWVTRGTSGASAPSASSGL